MVMNKVPYAREKMEQLQRRLQNAEAAGSPNEFEIIIDGMPVVNRTDDMEQFDNYLYELDDNTHILTVKIYFGKSNNNNQYSFEVNPQTAEASAPVIQLHPQPAPLNGLGEVEAMVKKGIEEYKKEQEKERLLAKIQTLEADLKDCLEYKDKLEAALEDERRNKFRFRGANIAEFGSELLTGMIRKNPQWLRKLPMGEALAGFIIQDTKELEEAAGSPPAPEPEGSFKAKATPAVSEAQRFHIALLDELSRSLDQGQLDKIMAVLQRLSGEPALTDPLNAWLQNQ